MNKVYSSKEIARIIYLMNEIEGYDESIEEMDCYDDLLVYLVLNLEGRIIGDELLLEKPIGSIITSEMVIDDDESYGIVTNIINSHKLEDDSFELVFDEKYKLLVEKRLKAFKTLLDAIIELRNSYLEELE